MQRRRGWLARDRRVSSLSQSGISRVTKEWSASRSIVANAPIEIYTDDATPAHTRDEEQLPRPLAIAVVVCDGDEHTHNYTLYIYRSADPCEFLFVCI